MYIFLLHLVRFLLLNIIYLIGCKVEFIGKCFGFRKGYLVNASLFCNFVLNIFIRSCSIQTIVGFCY